MIESKRERFMRVMQKRVERIKHEYKLLGNMANKYTYDYEIGMVNQVEDELLKYFDINLKILKQGKEKKRIKPFQFKSDQITL